MQLGNVGAYQPDAPVNDVQSRTEDFVTGDSLIPSLQPFAPPPVVVVEDNAGMWATFAAIGGLVVLAWFMASPRR